MTDYEKVVLSVMRELDERIENYEFDDDVQEADALDSFRAWFFSRYLEKK